MKKVLNKNGVCLQSDGAGFTDSVFSFKNSVLSLTENKLQNILRFSLGAVEEHHTLINLGCDDHEDDAAYDTDYYGEYTHRY